MSTDRLTVQMVVVFIGLFGLVTIGGLIALAYAGRSIPEPLAALGGAAVGALGSLLARTSTPEQPEGHNVDGANSASPTAKPEEDASASGPREKLTP